MRRLLLWSIVLAANVYLWALVVFSGFSPDQCYGDKCSAGQPESYVSRLLFPLRWVLRFIDGHEGFAVAIGTATLAIFTYFLYDSTRRLVEGADDTARRQLRAYVSPSGIVSYNVTNIGDAEPSWRFRVTWANTGVTPTRGLILFVDGGIFDAVLPGTHNFKNERTDPLFPPGAGMMGAHSVAQSGIIPRPGRVAVTLSTAREMTAGQKFLYLWGSATYADVFPGTPRRITRFAWQIVVSNFSDNPAEVSFGNVYLKNGNCTDDECTEQQ